MDLLVALAGGLFVVLAAGVVAFQLAVAAGQPWGHLTMGGRFPGVLPPVMRGAAVLSALLLVVFALVLTTWLGWTFPGQRDAVAIPRWVVVGYSVLGIVANAATPSAAERRLWLPVTALMAGSAITVALA